MFSPGTPSLSSPTSFRLGSPSPSSTSSHHSEAHYQLLTFKKSIKRDISDYDVFKDDRYYDTFRRSLEATASAHDLEHLLDITFTPSSHDPDAKALFQEQQKFMYKVLLKILQTDETRAIVRQHAKDKDAQKIIHEVHQFYTNSSVAAKEITRLTTYITNVRLDNSWRGTTESFLLHFREQLRLLDDLQPLSEQMPSSTRMTLLQNAVDGVSDLRKVKTMAEMLQIRDPSYKLSFQDYYSLLKNAAFHYDQSQKYKVLESMKLSVFNHVATHA
jgi:hypothetical protein